MIKKDKYHSIEGYHFKELMENGRCLNCGKLVKFETIHSLVRFYACCETCENIIKDFIDTYNQN